LKNRWFRLAAWVLALPLCAQDFRVPDKLDLRLPNKEGSFRFAVIGDQGDASPNQHQIAELMTAYHKVFPFTIVLMTGDMIYGSRSPEDYVAKFDKPYHALLADGVKFYGTLGNHDNQEEAKYPGFNMDGQPYYTFSPREGVRFFALDTNSVDTIQAKWLQGELGKARGGWKIVFSHHPAYSSAKTHGPNPSVQKLFVPIFIRYGVQVVFAGHDHVYERFKVRDGVQYFTEGSSGKLRKGDLQKNPETAVGYDQDNSFMLVEIDGSRLHFQTVSRTGEVIDSGVVPESRGERRESNAPAATSAR
jgi:hypothetical protein